MLNKGIGETSLSRVFELIEEKVKYLKKLIEGKANSSHSHSSSEVTGLSTVATSGSYNDLKNIPTTINATTLAGYGLRIVTDENDPGKTGYITIIK